MTRARHNALPWLLCALAACTPTRFKDQPIVWQVDDSRDIDEPEELEFWPVEYMGDVFLTRRLPRFLELRDSDPALNTNALDEVPDSTWFHNRIGVRRVSLEEAVRGSGDGQPLRPPLTVVAGKSGGQNPGFFARDETGRTFLVKFDTLDNPEMQTATGVIVNRIFWTLGYHVDSNQVANIERADLRIAPGATVKDDLNRKQSLTDAHIDEILATSPRRADGRYRIFVSQFLPGVPKGGISPEGRRHDDPNDTVPHEKHRELRGLRVFAAWTGHTDMKEDNTLDMYVEEDGRHFLRHYLIDFGEALGGHQAEKGRYEDGWEHWWDWQNQGKAALALGLWKRPWEGQQQTPWLSVGAFSASHFDPTTWREAYPYWPFFEMDAADAFWAAKMVMRFDRPLLAAIVATGKLSHPEAEAYLVETLLERARIIGHTYVEALTPLDEFRADDGKLCAVDLGVRFGLATSGTVEFLDRHGRVVSRRTVQADGRVCWPAPRTDRYRVLRLRTRRGPMRKPAMELHVKGGARPRVLGVVRVPQ